MLWSNDPEHSKPIGSYKIPINSGRVELWADIYLNSLDEYDYDVLVFHGYELMDVDIQGRAYLKGENSTISVAWNTPPEINGDVRLVLRLLAGAEGADSATYIARGTASSDSDTAGPTCTQEIEPHNAAPYDIPVRMLTPDEIPHFEAESAQIYAAPEPGSTGRLISVRSLDGIHETTACGIYDDSPPGQFYTMALDDQTGAHQAFIFPSGDAEIGQDEFAFGGHSSNLAIRD